MRFLLYALLVVVAIAAGHRLLSPVFAPEMEVVDEDSQTFPDKYLRREDLARLGCMVSATPSVGKSEVPRLGLVMEGYALTSPQPCASRLISTVQPLQGEDPGAWAAVRGHMSSVAEHYGWAHQRLQGRVGEYSEVGLFSLNGRPVGFMYLVQANGYLLSVMLISDSILPDERFEAILREKL